MELLLESTTDNFDWFQYSKYFVYRMFLTILILYFLAELTTANETRLISRTRTSFLDKYEGYKDVVMIRLQVPQHSLFASFKFMAEETQMALFGCKARNVSLFMKQGSPPVINPDGSKFPKNVKNITRNKLYNLEFESDKRNNYINITSPEPGFYYAATFLSYTDPKYNAITQQGLSPSCYANLEATVYIEKIENPLIITKDDLVEVSSFTGVSRYLKFFVPHTYDYILVNIDSIHFSQNANQLTVRVEVNKPPSKNVHREERTFYSNASSHSIPVWTEPDAWHFIELRFGNRTIQNDTTTSSVTFKLKHFSNRLSQDFYDYEILTNETFYNNTFTKVYRSNNVTDLVPYKQYDLIRDASSETFLFSFVLEEELESNMAIPINMTNKHLSVLKFRIRDSTEVGGTIQFIMAFKPRVKRRNSSISFEVEPEKHVVVACIRKDSLEIPTWPDKCASYGDMKLSPLILNKTTENATVLIPYPETGIWYATFKLFCGGCAPCDCPKNCQSKYERCISECVTSCTSSDSCGSCSSNCSINVIGTEGCSGCDCDGPCLRNETNTCNSSIVFDIGSYPCVYGQCSQNGKCMFMVSDGVVFSTCVCLNKYRGWDCSDGSQATPYYMVVIELLLLVLSNLSFLPAVYLAFKSRYYIESISYFAICFFSTFYHACDAGENIISYCLVRIDALQFGDFFCALLAIWVTLIAIADLAPLYSSIAHISGAIILAFCTTINKTALWIFTLPVGIGTFLIAVNWYIKYRKVKQGFANRQYLTYHIPCGAILVIVGLIVYAFLQTENNYKYLHSMWHVMMATAILVILPRRNTFRPDVLL